MRRQAHQKAPVIMRRQRVKRIGRRALRDAVDAFDQRDQRGRTDHRERGRAAQLQDGQIAAELDRIAEALLRYHDERPARQRLAAPLRAGGLRRNDDALGKPPVVACFEALPSFGKIAGAQQRRREIEPRIGGVGIDAQCIAQDRQRFWSARGVLVEQIAEIV